MKGAIEATFHGQKTFRLGSLSWSETPHFHNNGTFTNSANVAPKYKKNLLFQTATYISGTK